MGTLHIAEIPYPSGSIQYRYSRYLSDDGQRWVRHGQFSAYYEDGSVKSDGNYEHGLEHGAWRDFHSNGTVAAEGRYEDGVHVGIWRFWDAHENPEESVNYDNPSGAS